MYTCGWQLPVLQVSLQPSSGPVMQGIVQWLPLRASWVCAALGTALVGHPRKHRGMPAAQLTSVWHVIAGQSSGELPEPVQT